MDAAKVRAYLRKMPHQYIFAMLDEAVGLLPKAKLDLLVRRYVSTEGVQKEALPSKSRPTLVAEVSDFVERQSSRRLLRVLQRQLEELH